MTTVIVKARETGEPVHIKPGDMIDNKLVRRIIISEGDDCSIAVIRFDDGTESTPFDIVSGGETWQQ